MLDNKIVFTVSDFVASLNQTLEYAYPNVSIVGELANFRVSKNRWVYFDLKDDLASVKFFGTVYSLPGPLEDGLMLEVKGQPRLHHLFGFSINIQTINPVGEGSLKKAAKLLENKLRAEGLFDLDRKRLLPYPPSKIGLITSAQSAAYADFIKVLNERWTGLNIQLADVQVQGEPAPNQIAKALEYFNQMADLVDALVITRGGGSAEDLAAFNNEHVVRTLAASRIPTMVAIGHEVDISLAELVADQRASTPSNAAQLLVPDKRQTMDVLSETKRTLGAIVDNKLKETNKHVKQQAIQLNKSIIQYFNQFNQSLTIKTSLLGSLNPKNVLKKGYALVRLDNQVIKTSKVLRTGDKVKLEFFDSRADASITGTNEG